METFTLKAYFLKYQYVDNQFSTASYNIWKEFIAMNVLGNDKDNRVISHRLPKF